MRLCFLVVYNVVNSIGRDVLKNKNINVIPFLKKSVLETLTQHKQNIVRCSAYVVRLANDLATSPVKQFF
ncbi:unnamed protein product, partial [Arabidopsis halleri]